MPRFVPLLEANTSRWFINKEQQLEIREGFDSPEMVQARQELNSARAALEALLEHARQHVNAKAVWKIAGGDYMYELPAASTKNDQIPKDWKEEKVSAKTKRRFWSADLRQKAARLGEAQLEFDQRSRVAGKTCKGLPRKNKHF